MKTKLTEDFGLSYPIIMAPMFLATNIEMLVAAAKANIIGCIPSLNFKTPKEFEEGLKSLHSQIGKHFGINLIVNKSNTFLESHLKLCEKYPPAFVITSLGSPEEVIKRLRPLGVKVLCDVVNSEMALKVEALGADYVVAVNNSAGGHAGPLASNILIPQLTKACKIPIISAGGVSTGESFLSMMALGAQGISVGSPFLATKECPVHPDYKKAILEYGANDIALSDKISGTPCTVIKTPYVEKIGLHQNVLEKFLNSNKKIKKYAKMLTYYKGMKSLEKAAFSATYKSVWCAGPSIEFVTKELSIKEWVDQLIQEYKQALTRLL